MAPNPLLKSIAALMTSCPSQEPVIPIHGNPLVPLGKVADLTTHSDGMVRDNHPLVPVFYDIVPLGAAERKSKGPARKKTTKKKTATRKAKKKR